MINAVFITMFIRIYKQIIKAESHRFPTGICKEVVISSSEGNFPAMCLEGLTEAHQIRTRIADLLIEIRTGYF